MDATGKRPAGGLEKPTNNKEIRYGTGITSNGAWLYVFNPNGRTRSRSLLQSLNVGIKRKMFTAQNGLELFLIRIALLARIRDFNGPGIFVQE